MKKHPVNTLMKRKLSLLAGTLLLVASCLAQRTLALSDLSFRSDFEKNAFAKIDTNREKSTPADIIAVMMAGNVDTDDKSWQQAIQHINTIIASLEEEKIGEKKAKKALKIIFEKVHGHLRLYDLNAHFDQIFIDGTYNCLTASALYAYILQHFHIPYTIIQVPTHVFVIVDVEGDSYILETTDPTGGLVELDKAKVVAGLRQQKLIGDQETRGKTVGEIYNDYFKDTQTPVSFLQLAGLSYFNLSVEEQEAKKYTESLELINKSVFIYPSTIADNNRRILLLLLMERASEDKPESFASYFELFYYTDIQRELNKNLPAVYETIAKKHLIQNYSKEKDAAFYRYFIENLTKLDLPKDDINYIHFFYTGISLALRRNYAESLVMLDSAYQLKPGNLALQNMIEEELNEVLELPYPESTLKLSSDSLLTKYPFLSENDRFITYHCYQQLEELLTLIDNSNEKEAIAAVQVYQPKLDALKPSSQYDKSVEMIYASVYRIYVKHDDYRNGRVWLEKGLDLVPGSDLLQQKMGQLEEHVKKYGQDPYPKRKGNK